MWLSGWRNYTLLFDKKNPLNDGDIENSDVKANDLPNFEPLFYQKEYYNFKVVEIMDSKSIKIHKEFKFRKFMDTDSPRMFLSDDHEYLVELLSDEKIYLHHWIQSGSDLTQGAFHLVRKLEDYDRTFHPNTIYPMLLSPDFTRHLDFKEGKNQFVIRNAVSGDVYLDIPTHVMNLEGSDIKKVMNRFKWVDRNSFFFIDNSGFERYIKVDEGFRELGYTFIPSFTLAETEDNHYYYSPVEAEKT